MWERAKERKREGRKGGKEKEGGKGRKKEKENSMRKKHSVIRFNLRAKL